jgi:hypothetical protein
MPEPGPMGEIGNRAAVGGATRVFTGAKDTGETFAILYEPRGVEWVFGEDANKFHEVVRPPPATAACRGERTALQRQSGRSLRLSTRSRKRSTRQPASQDRSRRQRPREARAAGVLPRRNRNGTCRCRSSWSSLVSWGWLFICGLLCRRHSCGSVAFRSETRLRPDPARPTSTGWRRCRCSGMQKGLTPR